MKRNNMLILLLLLTQQTFAQHIQRKGSLGVGYFQRLADSTAARLQYKQGAVVQFVLPGTTAESLALQPYDIITKINETVVQSPQQLPVIAKMLREGNPITVTVIRNHKTLQLKTRVVARPMEMSSTADIFYDEFAYNKGYVRTIYKTPKGKKPLGTVFFLQGLPCYSMDNFKDLDITKQAIDAMVDRGFAVYRMEKADMGDNTNMPPCETMGFDEELDMYRAGYKNLLTLPQVDKKTVFLFGHSMGGLVAPLIANEYQPKGIIVYGTVFKQWVDYLIDAYLIQLQYYGENLAVLRDTIEAAKPYIYDYFYSDKTVEEVIKNEKGLAAMELIINYDAKTGLGSSGRSARFHKEMNQHNITKAWGNTKSAVLAIYGEADMAANNADDHKALVNYINKMRPGNASFWQAAGTTHNFEEIGTMEDFVKWQADPAGFAAYASTRFNTKLFDYACNWMKDVLAKK